MPAIGSSSSSSSGSAARVIAISSWRCSPWLTAPARSSATSGETHPLERRHCRPDERRVVSRRAPEPETAAVARQHRQHHIVHHPHSGHDAGDLERARETQPGPGMSRPAGDVAPAEQHAAPVRPKLPGKHGDQGCLAGSVRPDHGMDLAAAHLHRHAIDGGDAAETLLAGPRPGAGVRQPRRPSSSPASPPRANSTTRMSSRPKGSCQ